MKKIAIIQSSLREGSHTNIVCKVFAEKVKSAGLEVEYIDLRNIKLEFCDGRDFGEYNEDIHEAYKKIEDADVIIFGVPVYQYSISGVLKNFIDICGGAMKGDIVGAIVNAGGPNCYMASQDLFNALQFEYATTNIMPTPYTWSMDFKDGKLENSKISEKLDQLLEKIKNV